MTQVKELQYQYVMRRWHSIMLSLHELADSLSAKSTVELVQTFSFFVQSCLEDKQLTQWLADFYTKAGRSNINLLNYNLVLMPTVLFYTVTWSDLNCRSPVHSEQNSLPH